MIHPPAPVARVSLVLVLAVALLSGCAQPRPEASPTPLPELAAEPDALLTEPVPLVSPAASPEPDPTAPATPPPGDAASPRGGQPPRETAPPGPAETPPTERARGFGAVVVVDDAGGDEGLEAPSYADVRRLTLQDDGERLRVWVDVGADLPATLDEGEVMGVGVDLFLGEGDESDYQLFADGGSDGWRAYFQTPGGFVEFPGSFGLGGRRLEFVVAWNAMGTPSRGAVGGFIDWSEERALLNAAGSDRVPDRGLARWAR